MRYARLEELRKIHGLLQKDIANVLCTTKKQYSRWETGEYEIPFHHVITLAKLYNVSADYIAEITDTPYPSAKKHAGRGFLYL